MNPHAMGNRLRQESRLQLAHLNAVAPQNHTLYLVEASVSEDEETGLPVFGGERTTLITPGPRVVLGGEMVTGDGGGKVRVGDASVTHLRFDLWPIERLMAAVAFRIDDPKGDQYQILTGSIRETGINTLTLILQRVETRRTTDADEP